jgi:peptidoglycan/xylan/chitin deacetylase (PgdA/CDA1 family)
MTYRGVRAILPRLLAACLYVCGLVALARWWTSMSGPHLIILTYHRASDRALRRQLRYLQRHYRILPLDRALAELFAPSDRSSTVALTFDDGYHDSCLHAARLAREMRMPITIFLIPGYVESGQRFWWHETAHLVQATSVSEATVAGQSYRLDRNGRVALASDLYDAACWSRSVAEREALLAHAREQLHVAPDAAEEDGCSRSLTWPEVRETHEAGWVDFGAHTVHHPVLAGLRDPAEVEREVGGCRRLLEDRMQRPVRSFAYPLGRMEHIGDRGLGAVREAGYECAVTTIKGLNTPQTDPHLLRRIGVGAEQHWLVLAADMAGVWPFGRLRLGARTQRATGVQWR